jgi:hypothetical protein
MGKHVHAEVIHAWADGAEVQVKWESVGWQNSTEPAWFPEWEYRIKPTTPKSQWVELTRDDVDSWPLLESPTVYEFAKYIEQKVMEKNR